MASIPLVITNGEAPYTISVKVVGDPTERFISYSSDILTFTGDGSGSIKTYSVSVVDNNGCESSGGFNLNCANPNFIVDILQPYCSSASGGTLQNAVIKLTNITNSARYKICTNTTTFTSGCQSTCSVSDGIISGSSIDISITPPTSGTTRNDVIRVYKDSSCDHYTDIVYSLASPACDGQYTMVVLDYLTNTSTGSNCSSPLTDFNIYVTPNTVGITENGQKAQTKGGSIRNVPNGNEVPNVMISAALLLSCGPAPFYRFAFNLGYLKAAYPSINIFTFDVYAEKLYGTNNVLSPQTNTFPGVRMIKQLYGTTPPNSNDALRDPLYAGTFVTQPNHTYNNSISGFRKIGTLTYNYSANTVTYVNVT